MSLGYADRLSYREDLGGRLGAPELHEAPHVVLDRALQLAELVRVHVVCVHVCVCPDAGSM
jgi:mono-ADP-ribosyltransferase sirtuin 6